MQVIPQRAQHDAAVDEIACAEFYSAAAMMAALHLALFLSKIGLAFVGLFHILSGRCSPYTAILAFWLWPFSGLGVTAGVHRLWTHGSYRPTFTMEAILLFMFSMADQGPVLNWCLTHKAHHRYSDTDLDPHNRKKGFWHSHFGWVLADTPITIISIDQMHFYTRYTWIVRLHDKVSMWWDPLCSLGLPMLICSRWGDPYGGLLVAGALRWFTVQHFTFFVNSMAHGEPHEGDEHKFDESVTDIGPRTSLLVTFCALGEGWHDYHHAFPWDYAAAELDAWEQWNPTKVFIDTCYNLGLCSHRRRCKVSSQIVRRAVGVKLDRRSHVPPSTHDGEGDLAAVSGCLDTRAGIEKEKAELTDEGRKFFEQYEVRGWPFMKYRVRRKESEVKEANKVVDSVNALREAVAAAPPDFVAASPVSEREAYPVRQLSKAGAPTTRVVSRG